MRVRRLAILVALLTVVVGLGCLAAKPLLMAHGEFRTTVHIAGMALEMQFALNVQDRGEEDHGEMSIRVFDWHTGELIAVLISTDIRYVEPWLNGVSFIVDLRAAKGVLTMPETLPIKLIDDPSGDKIAIAGLWMDVEEGGIVIR